MVMNEIFGCLKDHNIWGWVFTVFFLIINIIQYLNCPQDNKRGSKYADNAPKQNPNNYSNRRIRTGCNQTKVDSNQSSRDCCSDCQRIDNYKYKISQLEDEKRKLENEKSELVRANNELNKLNESKPVEKIDIETSAYLSAFSKYDNSCQGNMKEDAGVVKYASFPRTVENRIYFSDVTDSKLEDSYFELRVSMETGKATFKPIDFIQIRNYDSAMSVIQTQGVKPNVADKVIGVEPGTAHLEGNDWFIDSLVKIKLA